RHAEGNHGTPRTDDARGLVGNLTRHGNPERHDFPIGGVKAEPESLAQHRLWSDLHADYPDHDVGLGVLHLLRSHRDRTYWARRLVCMEMAQAGSNITGEGT